MHDKKIVITNEVDDSIQYYIVNSEDDSIQTFESLDELNKELQNIGIESEVKRTKTSEVKHSN